MTADDDDEIKASDTSELTGFVETEETLIVDVLPGNSRSTSQQAYLVVLAGNKVGEMVKVGDGLCVGRGDESNFQLNDHGVSRAHLAIKPRPDGAVAVSDLGSRNGTFLNGIQIKSDMVLKDGDKIHIGSTVILKFSYADNLEESFQRDMYQAALRDPLTHLYNRRYLESQLGIEFSYVRRHKTPLSLIMMDIDFFKKVNDTHGHLVGDEVLAGFAGRLLHNIRGEDLAARYGGEEFIIVCRSVDSKTADLIANRIRNDTSAQRFSKQVPDLSVTISAGIATVPHPEIEDSTSMIAAADKALYAAKRGGRDKVISFE